LADKEAIRTIRLKRNQKYTDEDYHYLESLMYDRMSLKLDDAQVSSQSDGHFKVLISCQFIVGNNLQSCLEALESGSSDSLHIVERVNLDLQVQNSIVPSAVSLARFKISGKLPSLHVNFSDVKYKSLMRLIEVCIPRFANDETGSISPSTVTRPSTDGFQLSSGLFGQSEMEYNVDDNDNEDKGDDDEGSMSREELFFEAEDGSPEVRPQ
jgi:vacuolar protein sorting-associated protein 13A/C